MIIYKKKMSVNIFPKASILLWYYNIDIKAFECFGGDYKILRYTLYIMIQNRNILNVLLYGHVTQYSNAALCKT